MKQEDKELLLKDLCGRLPYHPFFKRKDDIMPLYNVNTYCGVIDCIPSIKIEDCRLYLRPMSSMTEEEKADLEEYSKQELDKYADAVLDRADKDTVRYAQVALMYKDIDWYTKKHFDYRGLIPMGLALPATEGMYNIK